MANHLIPSDSALGESEAFLAMQERISRAARTERPVILIGERGTGKELAAARLHLLSARWGQPYVTLNCASLSPTLIESELFGHEAGSFTGATRQRKGRFEAADGGTLFLDEIANIPLTAQDKILRVVEYGTMERVGASHTLRVNTRLVSATNVDLRRLADEGRFRRDLLDRLAFEVITLPPLRARGDDVLLLARHFARRMASELELAAVPVLAPAAERALREYPWPGNVRELKNVVERMVYRAAGEALTGTQPAGSARRATAAPRIDTIEFDPFDSAWSPAEPPRPVEGQDSAPPPPRAHEGPAAQAGPVDFAAEIAQLELRLVRRALEATRNHQRRAAAWLDLSYDQFRGLYRKYQRMLD